MMVFFHFVQDLKFELKVKNLALTDSRGYDLQKDIVVKVTSIKTQQVSAQYIYDYFFCMQQNSTLLNILYNAHTLVQFLLISFILCVVLL